MKKLFKNKFNILVGAFLCSAITGTLSCKKQLSALYPNPDGFTTASIEGLYTNFEQQRGIYIYNYGQMYHVWGDYFNPMLGTGSTANVEGYTNIAIGYDPFSSAYSWLRSYRDMNKFISQLPADQQTAYQPFTWTANITKDYVFYNLTDACGPVPYTDALLAQNDVFFPKYDSQQFIYEAVLKDLADISAKLKGYQLGGDVVALTFQKNDILFQGNMAKWRIFANSLRMRLALRLTNVEPDLAKSTIQDVLADGQYVQSTADNVTIVDHDSALPTNYVNSGSIFRTFEERRDVLFLPQEMLDVLQKAGEPTDPRLQVLFQPDVNMKYEAMPTTAAGIGALPMVPTQADLTKTFPSIYNRTTFETNFALPEPIITSPEIHLIKAEAAIRWPDLGLNAATEYGAAIQESIDYYYAVSALSPNPNTYPGVANLLPASEAQPAKPSDADITDFVNVKVADFNAASDLEKKGLIYDQRYVHYNVLMPFELWADSRRLVKELGTRVIHAENNIKQAERFLYPSSEASNNTQNFSAVASQDNYTTPVWWTGR